MLLFPVFRPLSPKALPLGLCRSLVQSPRHQSCLRVTFSTVTPSRTEKDQQPTVTKTEAPNTDPISQPANNIWQPPPKKQFTYKKDILSTNRPEATEYVKLSFLPPTVHPEDLRKLVRDSQLSKSTDKMILDIAFSRNRYFQFTGICVIQFPSHAEANRFVTNSCDKLVGGNKIKFEYVHRQGDKDSYMVMNRFRPVEIRSASGRSVILSGFPTSVGPDDLRDYLKLQHIYSVDTSADSIVELAVANHAHIKKFLIKLATENDAYRAARILNHRRYRFQPQYLIRASVAY